MGSKYLNGFYYLMSPPCVRIFSNQSISREGERLVNIGMSENCDQGG